jgi:ubiquinone biosynthesis UbiH/UbiF/VisC/COQ6 family hydroxylase
MADYDVVVAGAGLVGAVAALGLAELGKRVLVVEPRVPQRVPGPSGFEARTVALNPASHALLEAHASWTDMAPHPFHAIRVWEDTGTRAISFQAEEVERAELGWIVEVGRASVALWRDLDAANGVSVLAGETISGLEVRTDDLSLRIGADTVSARLLIGADGAQSGVRGLIGVAAPPLETPHAALAAVVATEHDSAGVAYQRFLADGPVALLPLPGSEAGGYSSVIWSQPREEARRRLGLSDAEFAWELERATEGVLGRIGSVDRRVVFDLDQRVAQTFYPSQRVVLLGDAARVLHPLAGQGANIGLEDVTDMLGVAIRHSAAMDFDPGAPGLWRGYARRRRAKALLLVRLMDGFRLGYSLDDPLLRLLRNAAVQALDRSGFVKASLIREALGLGLSAR